MDNQTGSDVDPSSRKSLAVDYGGMMVKSRCRFYERITKGQVDWCFTAHMQLAAHMHRRLSSAKCSFPHYEVPSMRLRIVP